jgi:hypothetical protein
MGTGSYWSWDVHDVLNLDLFLQFIVQVMMSTGINWSWDAHEVLNLDLFLQFIVQVQ